MDGFSLPPPRPVMALMDAPSTLRLRSVTARDGGSPRLPSLISRSMELLAVTAGRRSLEASQSNGLPLPLLVPSASRLAEPRSPHLLETASTRLAKARPHRPSPHAATRSFKTLPRRPPALVATRSVKASPPRPPPQEATHLVRAHPYRPSPLAAIRLTKPARLSLTARASTLLVKVAVHCPPRLGPTRPVNALRPRLPSLTARRLSHAFFPRKMRTNLLDGAQLRSPLQHALRVHCWLLTPDLEASSRLHLPPRYWTSSAFSGQIHFVWRSCATCGRPGVCS